MTAPVPRSTRHMPSTSAEDRDDEIPADSDRWEHVAELDQEPDGSWISRR